MEFWVFVLAVIALSMFGDTIKKYMHRRSVGTERDIDDLMTEIDELTDRVRVLEEIVTDDRHRLNQDIAELEAN